jgi:hypothetical protein
VGVGEVLGAEDFGFAVGGESGEGVAEFGGLVFAVLRLFSWKMTRVYFPWVRGVVGAKGAGVMAARRLAKAVAWPGMGETVRSSFGVLVCAVWRCVEAAALGCFVVAVALIRRGFRKRSVSLLVMTGAATFPQPRVPRT